jgi:PAS domain S-box-containing protein
MILDQDKINRIKKLLKARPKGLTISDISQTLKINRNSAAKYLEILLITGQVEMRLYGNAKVYYLSSRVPISAMLKFATELILVLDAERRITEVNDNFLRFFDLNQEDIVGTELKALQGADPFPILVDGLLGGLGEGRDLSRELSLNLKGERKYLRIKGIPTVFDDGSKGFTLIMEDITVSRGYEEKLRLNEARYRAIVQDQTEFITRFTPDFTLTFVNDALCQYMKRAPDELLGVNFVSFLYEEDRNRIASNISALTVDNQVFTHEERVIDPEGRVRWHLWTNRAIFGETGTIVEYQGVGRDITEQKAAEQDLLVRTMAMDSSINGIGIADLEGRITYANTAYLKMFGYGSLEEVAGMPREMFAHGDDESLGSIHHVREALLSKGKWMGEITPRRRDGTRFDAYLSANLVHDENGRPICMMASFIDLTAYKEAERELRIKNTAIESAINGIIIFDPDEKPIFANQAFLKMFDFDSLDEMNSRRRGDFLRMIQGMQPTSQEIISELKEKGSWVGEARTRMMDGSTVYFQLSATMVKDQYGVPLCSMAIFMDITDQRLMERALKSTHEKLQEAIEFMPDPTFIVDRNRKVLAWNRALETLTGVNKEEMLGKDDYSRAFSFFGGSRPVLIDLLELPAHELARSYPAVRRFGDSIFVEAFVPGIHGGQGAYLWGKATPLFDHEGNSVGAIESLRDMSEWRRAKESLQEARERAKDRMTRPEHGAGTG